MSSTDAPAAPAVDELRQRVLARMQAGLGDRVVESHLIPGDDLWIRVRGDAWVATGEFVRDELGCDYFCFLSAIDWMPSPYGKGEDDPTEPPPERSTETIPGYSGGDTRMQVFARVYSTKEHFGLTLKTDVADDGPHLATWSSVYAGANWHEREAWEMFGIVFDGHPNLTHIYLPGDFEGHPLRKDFPLLARMVKPWPGIVDVEPMPGGEDTGDAE